MNFNMQEIKSILFVCLGNICRSPLAEGIAKQYIKKKNINIEVSLPEQLCLTLDKYMISTVLRNLITNAIKYTHKSGSISINLEEKEGRIQVSVKDNGIGIYKENIAKLFKITEKFSMQGTEQEEGTGLGLILSKEFIDLHNGEIMVESQIGKGSTFTFTLPL